MTKEIEQLTKALEANTAALNAFMSDYCNGDQAAAILGFNNKRCLKKLYEMQLLPRYYRENGGFRYKKSDCKRIATLLDSKEHGLSDQQKLVLYGGK